MPQWVESCNKIKKFHDEHIKKFGTHQKLIGRPRGSNKGWSVRQTAEALEISVGKCSEDIQLAKAIKDYPDILKLDERQDALLFLRRKRSMN